MKTYTFEKLNTWQDSRKLVVKVYGITKDFPSDEKYGLTSQLRRAMLSVSCNIAEGTTRKTYKEKLRFLEIAYASLMEVVNCLLISSDLGYISQGDLKEVRKGIDELYTMLNRLKRSYQAKMG